MRHRKLNRLKGYNYSRPGGYFVTICVKDRIDYFGIINGGKVVLNEYGQIANGIWLAIDKHYHNVDIDQYVIMPNHIHGIIFIKHCENVDNRLNDDAIVDNNLVSIKNYGLLSKVIKSFKNEFTKAIRENNQNNPFQWQRSYYDHIIRNEKALYNIRRYIINNPLKWELDVENEKNKTKSVDKYYEDIMNGD